MKTSNSAGHSGGGAKNCLNLLDLDYSLTSEEERAVARGIKQLMRGEYVEWGELKSELGL